MEKEPLVSVLMGIYNCADTLEQAVDCIINQTYQNWELIMCDDCSTDNTYSFAQKLAKKDSRIRLIKNEKNLTLAPTLNHCLSEAKGEYTARMDGDDTCALDRFEKEVEVLNNHPEFAVVSCKMHMFDDSGVYGMVDYMEYPQAEDFISHSQICHAGCMMRKSVLNELNGYNISPEIERIEDYDLWVRLYEKGYKAYNIQEVLYSMRDDRKTISRKKFKFRVTEYKLKKRICKTFNLPFKDRLKCCKPILLGLTPSFIYVALHKAAHKG